MAPKPFAVLCLTFLIASQPARARLGDTAEQCKERYGKPQPIKFEPPAEEKHIYRKDGATITAEFMGGKVALISYRKAKGKAFTPEEIGAKLEENGDGKPWGKSQVIPSGRGTALLWKRPDRSAQLLDSGRLLIFQSSDYANKRAAIWEKAGASRIKTKLVPVPTPEELKERLRANDKVKPPASDKETDHEQEHEQQIARGSKGL